MSVPQIDGQLASEVARQKEMAVQHSARVIRDIWGGHTQFKSKMSKMSLEFPRLLCVNRKMPIEGVKLSDDGDQSGSKYGCIINSPGFIGDVMPKAYYEKMT